MVKIREERTNLILLAKERNIEVLLYMGFRDRVAIIKAKSRVDHPKVGDILRRLASQCREHVSIATVLDT